MTLECLVSNPLRKQVFHQDYIDLRSLIIINEEALYQNWKNFSLIYSMKMHVNACKVFLARSKHLADQGRFCEALLCNRITQ